MSKSREILKSFVMKKLDEISDAEVIERLNSLNVTLPIVDMNAPTCKDCGVPMTTNGSCYKCENCGETSGCS